jgi:hypothetical protein
LKSYLVLYSYEFTTPPGVLGRKAKASAVVGFPTMLNFIIGFIFGFAAFAVSVRFLRFGMTWLIAHIERDMGVMVSQSKALFERIDPPAKSDPADWWKDGSK